MRPLIFQPGVVWRTLALTSTNDVLLFWSVKWMSWLVIIIYILLMFAFRDSAIVLIIAKHRSWKYFVSFLLYYYNQIQYYQHKSIGCFDPVKFQKMLSMINWPPSGSCGKALHYVCGGMYSRAQLLTSWIGSKYRGIKSQFVRVPWWGNICWGSASFDSYVPGWGHVH